MLVKKKKQMKKISSWLVLLCAVAVLAGCETQKPGVYDHPLTCPIDSSGYQLHSIKYETHGVKHVAISEWWCIAHDHPITVTNSASVFGL
jgi:hypothetical protein